jgi:hypothetical protein
VQLLFYPLSTLVLLSAKDTCTSLRASWFCLFMCNFDTFCFARSYKINTSQKRRYKPQTLCVGRHQGVAGFEVMTHRPHTQLPADYKQYLTNFGPTAFWDVTPWHIHHHLHGLPMDPKTVDVARSQYLVNTRSSLHHPLQLSLRLPAHTPWSLHHPHTTPIHGRLIIIHWHITSTSA